MQIKTIHYFLGANIFVERKREGVLCSHCQSHTQLVRLCKDSLKWYDGLTSFTKVTTMIQRDYEILGST